MTTFNSGPETRPAPTFLQSFKAFLGTWVDLLRTRLELLSTEIEEERERLEQALILAATSLFCLSFGTLLLTFFIVAVFWDTQYRLAVLGGFAFLYLVAGAVLALIARKRNRSRPRLLSATLAELAKDYKHLTSSL